MWDGALESWYLVFLVLDKQVYTNPGCQYFINNLHLVKETPRVVGFIGGSKNNPKSITDAEAAKILNQMEHGIEDTSQGTVYEPGEMIRVIDGPFNDFSGVVEEADNQKGKVKVAVMIFGRSTPVELDFSQIERG